MELLGPWGYRSCQICDTGGICYATTNLGVLLLSMFFSICAFGVWTIKFGNILIYLDSSRGVGRNRPLPTSCGLE
jgi:hypothetical protein